MDDYSAIASYYELDHFMKSEVGQALLHKFNATIEGIQRQLMDVDPDDAKKIRDLQLQGKAAELAMSWLEGIAQEGQQALDEISEADNEY